MSAWIGPAIIAAVISAIVTALGWYASHASNRRLEVERRRERIEDVQTAIRAEIRSHRPRLLLFRDMSASDAVQARIGVSMGDNSDFTPFVPREVESFVFDAIVGDIHILPSEIIDPVVYYYRQIATLAQFAEDLRSDRYFSLSAERKIAIYRDYIAIGVYALDLADGALQAIEED